VSPARRRSTIVHVQRDVGVSERRACRALGQARGTQRYQRRKKADEAALLQAIEALVCQHPCYGYRMIHALLVADGFVVGRDRVYRLWRHHGYGVKQKAVKKRRLGVSKNGIMRQKAASMNDVWCWDCVPCKGTGFQRVQLPPGKGSLQPVALEAANGGNAIR
jgi:putative transposase